MNNINHINLENKEWIICPKHIYSSRNRLLSLPNKSDSEICNEFNSKNIIKRIGSDSSQGEVYEAKIDNIESTVALKILPIKNDLDAEKNKNEIEIATLASKAVLEGKTEFFPIVYYSASCLNTDFDKKSLFKNESETYALRDHIRNQIIDNDENKERIQRKRFFNYTRNMTKNELIEYVKQQYPDFDQDYNIKSNILVSELAYSDLQSYINNYKINIPLYNLIIFQVISGIKDMQEVLNVIHADLHMGNILLLFYQDKCRSYCEGTSQHDFFKINSRKESVLEKTDKSAYYLSILIHDFGKSIKAGKIYSKWNKNSIFQDLFCFLNTIIQNTKVYDSVKNNILKLINNIENNNINNIQNALDYWEKITNIKPEK